MTPSTCSIEEQGIVRNLRSIRDQLSHEIKDMTFAQERAYLDQLLAEKPAANAQPAPPSASSPANASALP